MVVFVARQWWAFYRPITFLEPISDLFVLYRPLQKLLKTLVISAFGTLTGRPPTKPPAKTQTSTFALPPSSRILSVVETTSLYLPRPITTTEPQTGPTIVTMPRRSWTKFSILSRGSVSSRSTPSLIAMISHTNGQKAVSPVLRVHIIAVSVRSSDPNPKT